MLRKFLRALKKDSKAKNELFTAVSNCDLDNYDNKTELTNELFTLVKDGKLDKVKYYIEEKKSILIL